MEEILASIRRIISEDADTSKAPPAAAAAPKPAARPVMMEMDDDEDVLDLTNKVQDDGSVVNLDRPPVDRPMAARAAPNSLDLDFELDEDDGKEAAILRNDMDFDREFTADEEEPEDEAQDFSGLMSRASAAAASDAFADLQNAAPTPAPRPAPAAARSNGGVTLEEVVKDALVPVLRDWLDRNLPAMVEEMVQAEIQRLAQQGRRR